MLEGRGPVSQEPRRWRGLCTHQRKAQSQHELRKGKGPPVVQPSTPSATASCPAVQSVVSRSLTLMFPPMGPGSFSGSRTLNLPQQSAGPRSFATREAGPKRQMARVRATSASLETSQPLCGPQFGGGHGLESCVSGPKGGQGAGGGQGGV